MILCSRSCKTGAYDADITSVSRLDHHLFVTWGREGRRLSRFLLFHPRPMALRAGRALGDGTRIRVMRARTLVLGRRFGGFGAPGLFVCLRLPDIYRIGMSLTNCIFPGVAGLRQHGILRCGAVGLGLGLWDWGSGLDRKHCLRRGIAWGTTTTSANHEADERGP